MLAIILTLERQGAAAGVSGFPPRGEAIHASVFAVPILKTIVGNHSLRIARISQHRAAQCGGQVERDELYPSCCMDRRLTVLCGVVHSCPRPVAIVITCKDLA